MSHPRQFTVNVHQKTLWHTPSLWKRDASTGEKERQRFEWSLRSAILCQEPLGNPFGDSFVRVNQSAPNSTRNSQKISIEFLVEFLVAFTVALTVAFTVAFLFHFQVSYY